jgi:hypothetical protein
MAGTIRSQHPTLETLILDLISLDYHEALSVPAGHLAEAVKHESMTANKVSTCSWSMARYPLKMVVFTAKWPIRLPLSSYRKPLPGRRPS